MTSFLLLFCRCNGDLACRNAPGLDAEENACRGTKHLLFLNFSVLMVHSQIFFYHLNASQVKLLATELPERL
jgi:hypothetical protein